MTMILLLSRKNSNNGNVDDNNDELLLLLLKVRLVTSITFPSYPAIGIRNGNNNHNQYNYKKLFAKYNTVRSILVQMNTMSCQTYTSSLLLLSSEEEYDDDVDHRYCGPSGLLVQVEFMSNNNNNKSIFVQLVMEMIGQRYIIAPIGTIASLYNNQRLHRYISVRDTIVQLILPIDGSSSILSSEGMVSFITNYYNTIPTTTTSLWNPNDALSWSNWMLGVESEVTKKSLSNYQLVSNYYDSRRSMFMEWKRYNNTTIRYSQGLQYTMEERPSNKKLLLLLSSPIDEERNNNNNYNISIYDLLPPTIKQPIPPTQIQLVIPNNLKNYPISFGSQCIPNNDSSSTLEKSNVRNALLLTTTDSSSAADNDNNGYCIQITKPNIESKSNMEQYYDHDDYSIHYNIIRHGGQGGSGGTFVISLVNSNPYCPVTVAVTQAFPAVIQPLWRSIKGYIQSSVETLSSSSHSSIIQLLDLEYITVDYPSNKNGNYYNIQYHHTIPQQSILELSITYNSLYNGFESFPGDANRGFEIPPVLATFDILSSNNNNTQCRNWIIQQHHSMKQQPFDSNHYHNPVATTTLFTVITLYSNPLLLLVPLPDMSMPYNVLSITCTFYAFVIGSIFNLVIKKANEAIKYKFNPSSKPPNKLQQLKDRVREKVLRIKHKLLFIPRKQDREQRIKEE